MPVAAHESYRLVYDYIHGLTLEFWFDSNDGVYVNWIFPNQNHPMGLWQKLVDAKIRKEKWRIPWLIVTIVYVMIRGI